MYCSNCGKEIHNNSAFCSECGAPQRGAAFSSPTLHAEACSDPVNATTKKAPFNTMCIVGLVISGISLLLNFWGLVGIAGTIVSVIGLTGCQRNQERGKTLAIIGIVIGVFSIFYGLIMIFSL